MINHWELYESMQGWTLASLAIDKAWEKAKSIAPEKPSHERALLARDYVRRVMEKYRKFGAKDTEPDSILVELVNMHFSTRISRWD